MKQTPKRIALELKRLRKIVETSTDTTERRIAYSLEHAIRWATEDTVGWTKPHKEVGEIVTLLRNGK